MKRDERRLKTLLSLLLKALKKCFPTIEIFCSRKQVMRKKINPAV